MPTKRARAVDPDAVIGYVEIAQRLEVEVPTVRIYKVRYKDDFPKPVTPSWQRSPGFRSGDVDEWIELHKKRNEGKAGRPPGKRPKVEEAPVDEAPAKKEPGAASRPAASAAPKRPAATKRAQKGS